MPPERADRTARALHRQRTALLQRIERGLDLPMAALGFVWLALLAVDLIWGLSPLLQTLNNAIWILFVLNFALEFTIAPKKATYLRSNWLTALSLAAPALRMLRIVRIARALRAARMARGFRLLRIVSSVNRGLGALGRHMTRRGIGYVAAISLVVMLAGSAGIYAFENPAAGGTMKDYGTALWWTAMMMTTMGSEYWPRTPEGRLLCLLLAVYAFAVFGYLTATLASFFIGRDAAREAAPAERTAQQIKALAAEVSALRDELRRLTTPAPSAVTRPDESNSGARQ